MSGSNRHGDLPHPELAQLGEQLRSQLAAERWEQLRSECRSFAAELSAIVAELLPDLDRQECVSARDNLLDVIISSVLVAEGAAAIGRDELTVGMEHIECAAELLDESASRPQDD